jgi:hypothetical protein
MYRIYFVDPDSIPGKINPVHPVNPVKTPFKGIFVAHFLIR